MITLSRIPSRRLLGNGPDRSTLLLCRHVAIVAPPNIIESLR